MWAELSLSIRSLRAWKWLARRVRGSSEADGPYTVQATATDRVGNTSTGTAIRFNLDRTPATLGTFELDGNATAQTAPDWNQVYTFPYGVVPYDLDISADGKLVSASVAQASPAGALGADVVPTSRSAAGAIGIPAIAPPAS